MGERMRIMAILIAVMAAGYVGGLMSQANTRALAQGNTPITSDVVRVKQFKLIYIHYCAGKTEIAQEECRAWVSSDAFSESSYCVL